MADINIKEYLRGLANKKNSIYEDIRLKEVVKKNILGNPYIIHALNNTNLNESTPKDYFNVNVIPYYLITSVQTEINNYICYETSFQEIPRYNDSMKVQQVIFYIICNCSAPTNIIDSETGVARHDLLAALLIDQFNYNKDLGFQIQLVSDKSQSLDNQFCARTLVFEQTTPNAITKYNNGNVRVV